jgi:hypothetical protein
MPTIVSRRGAARAVPGCLLACLVPLLLGAEPPIWTPDYPAPGVWDLPSADATAPAMSRSRIRLFRFAPGFLSDPVGLQDQDDSRPGTPSVNPAVPDTPDNGPDWIQVTLGADNPYFDFRRPGDPGGIGFNRLVTQVQLLDTAKTSCTLDLQAVTPAGIQWFGVQDGPTVVVPSLGIFHAVDDDTALHGFIGKNMLLQGSLPTMPVHRSVNCGMALQRALLPTGPEAFRNLYFFMGALGEYQRPGPDAPPGTPGTMNWEVMPGVHWRLTESWWMSGGVILPARTVRPDGALPWQFTCSFQF